jgi:hypothetical protein
MVPTKSASMQCRATRCGQSNGWRRTIGTALALSQLRSGTIAIHTMRFGNMSQRVSNLVWLKDVLDHLQECQSRLEWTENADAMQDLTETMIRDLDCCHKLCQKLQRQAMILQAA